MRGNSHVQFLGEGRSVMAVSYPTADRHPTLYQEPRASRGVFYGLPSMAATLRAVATRR